MGRRPQEKRRGMKNVKNKKTLWMILTGLIIGAISVVLVANGNPKNMGFCVACFIRDIAGGVGMHQAAIVQYIRPEIIGLVLGALIMSVAGKEFKAQGGSSPATRFVLGAFVMVGALMFLGCPLRMVLRIAGGDLNAVVGLVGFVVGILAGIFCLNQGFSLRRTYEQSPLEGGMISAINVALLVLVVAAPPVIYFSTEGPGSMRAPLLQHRPGHPFQGQVRLFAPEDLLPQTVQHLAHPVGHLAAALFHGFFHLGLGQHLVHLGDRAQQFFFDLHLYLILSFENSSSRPKGGHSALIIHHPQALPQGRENRKKGRTCRPFFYSAWKTQR